MLEPTAPDPESFPYSLAVAPSPSVLPITWARLRMCERRLAIFKKVAAEALSHTPLLTVRVDDELGVFLLCLESALQILREESATQHPAKGRFNKWIGDQPGYDILLKGLRTLRHFEAHVQPRPTEKRATINAGHLTFVEGRLFREPGPLHVAGSFLLPQVDAEDLKRLLSPALSEPELPAWNDLRTSDDAEVLLGRGLAAAVSMAIGSR